MRQLLLGLAMSVALLGQAPAPVPMPHCSVYFSPRGGAQAAILHQIELSEVEIKIQAYSFTSRPIAEALIDARRRGVKVEVCADDSNKNPDTSITDELVDGGVSVFLDTKHAISHSKVMVIDRRTVISGSFNFSRAAESSNLENLLVIMSPDLARQYLANYAKHREHCTQLVTE
jgi:phosphatidylserine/phosphatidylglycerophosphate/cardiolipin synthase-like enzyme